MEVLKLSFQSVGRVKFQGGGLLKIRGLALFNSFKSKYIVITVLRCQRIKIACKPHGEKTPMSYDGRCALKVQRKTILCQTSKIIEYKLTIWECSSYVDLTHSKA
jgi:hypothetical protein